ncbi:P-loop containing nucleoside triphosphate hydrolase protein, partial [Meira miltonrushii]
SDTEKEDDFDSTPKASKSQHTSTFVPSSSSQEIFSLGDVVYIESNLTRPHLGILTDILTSEEAEEEKEGQTILCKLRYLYWPQDVSQVTSAKLSNLVDNDEVYYTHQAPRLLGKRRTKNSSRGGKGGEALTDNFEHGPSLLNMVVKADAILGKVTMHSSASNCRKAVASSPSRQNGVSFKRKRMPSHLFVKRAIDPQREVFWNVDWEAVVQRGKKNGKWDLAEGDDEIRKRMEDNEPKATTTPLTTPGKNANEWAKMLAKEKGITLSSTAKDRQEIRKQLEAKRIAALLDTPSKRRQKRMREKEERRMARATGDRPLKPARLNRNNDSALSSAESVSDLYESDSDESATSVTSDDDFALEEESEAESMLDIDDALFMDDEDEHDWDTAVRRTPSKKRRAGYAPTTPRKRKLLDGLTSSPVKAMATPKSKMRILGTVSLAPTALPARPKALDALPIKEVESMTAKQRAKRLLHVGATPESLPCRQDQFEEVMACLEDAVEDGLGGCVYVSGVPGTGKTATVREVIRNLQKRSERNEVSPFNFVEINGMKLQDAHDAYGVLWHSLTGMRCSNANALHHLSQHFGARQRSSNKLAITPSSMMGPGRATTVVLMDELDQMVTTRQDVMYNMFNWPNSQDSRLVVVAIANTMDLPERILHAKVASRLGMTRITFKPYNDRELVQIVHARLGIQTGEPPHQLSPFTQGCQRVFAPEALVYLAKRVSNVSGDARRMLDVCRRSIDAVEEGTKVVHLDQPVTIGEMKKVLDAMVKSGKGAHIAHLSLQQKMTIVAILAAVRRAGKAEVDLSTITNTHASLCRMHAIQLQNESKVGIHRVVYDEDDLGRLTSMSYLINHLCALGLVIAVGTGAAAARSGRYARYVLTCAEDEVRLALEQDEDVRLRNLL